MDTDPALYEAIVTGGDLVAIRALADLLLESGDSRGPMLLRRLKAWENDRVLSERRYGKMAADREEKIASYPERLKAWEAATADRVKAEQAYRRAVDEWEANSPGLIGWIRGSLTGADPYPRCPEVPAVLRSYPSPAPVLPDELPPSFVADRIESIDRRVRDYVRRLMHTPPGEARVLPRVKKDARPVWP